MGAENTLITHTSEIQTAVLTNTSSQKVRNPDKISRSRAMMMKKKNQFSQTEAVKVVDAATQTEEEVVEEKLRQVENEKSVQTEEEVVVELKSLVNYELSSQLTDAEVMELKKMPKQVDNMGMEKTPRQEDDGKLTLRKVDKLDQNGDEEETGPRYVAEPAWL